MDSSTALVTAASGLERLMVGNRDGILKDSTVAQVSAFVYYQANVVSKLTSNKMFQNRFSEVIFNQIDKDFGEYIDAMARGKSKSFHHVYEWNKVGNKTGRLFKLNKLSQNGLSFKLDYEFTLSKSAVPNKHSKRRHVFKNKAAVMEAGMPLTIAPKAAQRLVFESNGILIVMPKGASVTVRRPGGASVKNQFGLAYSRFFSGQLVGASIRKSGFQNIFREKMGKALKPPSNIKKVQYKFSANTIRMQAEQALTEAFGGAL